MSIISNRLTLFYFFIMICSCSSAYSFSPLIYQQPVFSLMLDPAGDVLNAGRAIDDSFERAMTLQCVEKLKELLEAEYPMIRVVLTRTPGEAVQPLQNANFANRLATDCFISLSFYYETEPKPKLYLYHFSYNDDFVTRGSNLIFYRFDQAHLYMIDRTKTWARLIKEQLDTEPFKKLFDVKGFYKLPIKPLIGVQAPAFYIEVGLKKKEDWRSVIEPLMISLKPIIDSSLQRSS